MSAASEAAKKGRDFSIVVFHLKHSCASLLFSLVRRYENVYLIPRKLTYWSQRKIEPQKLSWCELKEHIKHHRSIFSKQTNLAKRTQRRRESLNSGMTSSKKCLPSLDQQVPAVVELNVGGQLYTTSLTTLLRDQESLLNAMFTGRQKVLRDSRGRYFIDRDGALFRYILDYLRNSKLTLPEKFTELQQLIAEAEYFRLKGLVGAANEMIIKETKRVCGFLTLCVRGSYAFGRDGLADVKFRKLQRILVCGNVALAREAFGESLNETRDPDRDDIRYTYRFYLKHNHLEKAFDSLHEAGFQLVTSSAGGAGYDPESDETKWNHFNDYVFFRN